MTQTEPPLCIGCRFFMDTDNGWYCEVFGGRIPTAILLGQHDHREPYPGDNGIQYEPIDEEHDNGINNDNGNG